MEIAGVDETKISQKLRDELQALVGGHLDSKEADRLSRRLEAELPGYEVTHRMSRGSEAGRLLVVFTFAESAGGWLTVMSNRFEADLSPGPGQERGVRHRRRHTGPPVRGQLRTRGQR